eukprot:gene40155-49663_t
MADQFSCTPISLEVSQQGAYESNVLRSEDGLERNSTVSTSGLDVEVDQFWGRQHFQGGAGLAYQKFWNQDLLTNNPYNINGQLDWSAADLLEGVVTKLTLEGEVNAFNRQFSSDSTSARADQRYVAGLGGIRYQPSPDLWGRGIFRYTRGTFPERTASGDDYIRRDVEIGVNWKPSGASFLEAHVSAGRESHSLVTVQSVDVWAAGLSWRWQASGKLGLSLSLNRDSDTGSSTTLVVRDEGQVDLGNVGNTRTSTSAIAGIAWAATSKINFNVRGSVTRRELDGRRGGVEGFDGGDLMRAVNADVRYTPIRSLDLSCGVAFERRSVLGNVGNLSFAYDSTSALCG